MARPYLNTIQPGSIVRIKENDAATEFVVACHNYESGLNGAGRTLLVRKALLPDEIYWNLVDSTTDLNWNGANLQKWLDETYLARLDANIRDYIGTTAYYYNEKGKSGAPDRNNVYPTMRSSIFLLSAAELGNPRLTASYETAYDGTKLDDSVIAVLQAASGSPWWTRTVYPVSQKEDGEDMENWWYTRVYLYGYGLNTSYRNEWVVAECGFPYAEYGSTAHIRPCFTVPGSLRVDESGNLFVNTPPEIVSDLFGLDGLHLRRSCFRVPYSVHDADGDGMTVTEWLDDQLLQTLTPADSAVNYVTVTDEMLAALNPSEDHELRVRVTDGVSESEKRYRFRLAEGSGYIVYIGQITGNADGTGYYWTERSVLHNAADETAPILLDPEVTLEKNAFGSFVFTIPAENPWHDKITVKKTVISVEEDGREIFMGYVTELEKNFELDIEVTCEGELGYLQDRDCVIEEKTYTVEELLKLALIPDETYGGGFRTEGKAFNLGTVNVEKPEADLKEKETKAISDCWSVLDSNLVGNYGGYLRLRKEIKMEDGTLVYRRYLDYLVDIPDKTDQVIRFGENMLDLDYYIKSNTIVNSVLVMGYETTGWFIFSDTHPLVVQVVNQASIDKYGLCQRIITVDGTDSTKEFLVKKGTEELKKYNNGQFTGSLTVNAADLADVGVDADRLEFLKKTATISEAHGLSDCLLCTKEVIPLAALEEKSFTFGDTTNLSSLQVDSFGTAGKAWRAIQSTIKYVRSKG